MVKITQNKGRFREERKRFITAKEEEKKIVTN
jgi:hypothetical protein